MIKEVTNMNDIHEEVWDLLPWYVNGSVDDSEKALVEDHLQTCEICQREIASQKRLAAVLSDRRDLDAIEDAGWARLSAEIDDITQDNSPEDNIVQPIDFATERAKRRVTKPWIYPALMAACLAMFVFVGSDTQWIQTGDFRTLTNDNQASDLGDTIVSGSLRIKAADNISHTAMADLLSKHDLTIVDGPSPTGVYTVTSIDGANLDTAFTAMQSADEVVFVSKLEGN